MLELRLIDMYLLLQRYLINHLIIDIDRPFKLWCNIGNDMQICYISPPVIITSALHRLETEECSVRCEHFLACHNYLSGYSYWHITMLPYYQDNYHGDHAPATLICNKVISSPVLTTGNILGSWEDAEFLNISLSKRCLASFKK